MGMPFWLAERSAPIEERRLGGVDVEILGARITGCSAALSLAQAGLCVRIRDQRHIGDGVVQPARLVRRIAAAAAEAGAEIRTGTRVESLDDLRADHVVIATDGSGRGLIPELDDAIWPARGQVVATEPLAERLFDY